MCKWYSLDLGDGVESYGPTGKIQESFWPIYLACGSPKDMGVYSKYDLNKNAVTVYFTPSAKPLAEAFLATECEEPSSDHLGFLVGPGACLDIWPVGKRR